MTKRPVPPSRPWFSRRARLVSVPGLSLEYQPRISRTRSFIAEASLTGCRGVSAPVAAVAPAAARTAAAPRLRLEQPVAEVVELRLAHPADLARVDLGVA